MFNIDELKNVVDKIESSNDITFINFTNGASLTVAYKEDGSLNIMYVEETGRVYHIEGESITQLIKTWLEETKLFGQQICSNLADSVIWTAKQ